MPCDAKIKFSMFLKIISPIKGKYCSNKIYRHNISIICYLNVIFLLENFSMNSGQLTFNSIGVQLYFHNP